MERRQSDDRQYLTGGVNTEAAGRDPAVNPASGLFFKQIGYRVIRQAPSPRDVLVQCPKCKAMETLQFVGDTLSTCRKFHQRNGMVYHDCGSDQPCRLHR